MTTDTECQLLHQRVGDVEKIVDIKMTEIEKLLDSRMKDFHGHIREVRADLSDHIEEQAQHYADFMEASLRNTDAINKLTESTQGLIDAWTAANGAVKTMSFIGNIIKWFSAVGIAIGLIWAWITGGLSK